MNLVDSFERGLEWLAAPKHLAGRLEMQTQRGRRLEMEVISVSMRMPIAGAVVKIPVFLRILPAGSSPILGTQPSPDRNDA